MNFTLNVLGTASALPTTNRFPSAQVLDVRGRLFLIDCGEGTQLALRKQKISFLKIDTICLSHNHGDHIFGIFGLLSTMGLLGRTNTLYIYAPKSFQPILSFFLTHFGEGLKYEIKHIPLISDSPELVFETKTIELLAFPLNHRIDTYGFIIREKWPPYNVKKEAIAKYGLTIAEIATLKRGENVIRPAGEFSESCLKNEFKPCSGSSEPMTISVEEAAYIPYEPRSYAYCSDTAPFPELAKWVSGVDVLYHEATFPIEMSEMAESTFHSTTVQAAETALKAGVKKLLIGHYSSRYPDVSFFRDEAAKIFPETILAYDGMVLEVE